MEKLHVSDIYVYYEDFGHQDERDLLKFWRLSWEKQGWRTHVLTRQDATFHPKYDRFLAHTRSLPTVNHRGFEEACYLRWLAFAQQAGAVSDYDVIPIRHFPPREFEGFTNGQPDNMGFIVGRQAEFERFVDVILSYQPQPNDVAFDRPHVSDMIIVQRNQHIFEINERVSRTYMDQDWEKFPLVHFTNGSRKNRSVPRVQEIQDVLKTVTESETGST